MSSGFDLDKAHESSSRVDLRTRKVKKKTHFVNLCFDLRRPKENEHVDIDKLTDVRQASRHLDDHVREPTERVKQKRLTARDLDLPAGIMLPGERDSGAAGLEIDDTPLQRVNTTARNQYDCGKCGWTEHRLVFRNPNLRIFVATFIGLLNFLIYAEDPIAHSRLEAEIPLVGHAISMVMLQYPSGEAGLYAVKVLLAIALLVSGMYMGRQWVHHRLLRDHWKFKMFGEDRGTWMVMFFFTIVWLALGATVLYNWLFIDVFGMGDGSMKVNGKLSTDNETFMKIAATGTWMGDYLTAYMVIDMALQDNEYPDWAPKTRACYAGRVRIILFWVLTLALCSIVISFIAADVIDWDGLSSDFAFSTTEFSRALLAGVITAMDLLIVMQDWEFPTFITNQNVNLPGLDVHSIHFEPPAWMEFFSIHVSGKWFNYGIITCVMMLDFNMLKNQVTYVPGAYAQYVDPVNFQIWTITDPIDKLHYHECYLASNTTCIDRFYTFEARQLFPVGRAINNTDFRMNAEFRDYSAVRLGLTIVPACAAIILFVVLFSLENPKRYLRNQHLTGLSRSGGETFAALRAAGAGGSGDESHSRQQSTTANMDDMSPEEVEEWQRQQDDADRLATGVVDMPKHVAKFYKTKSKSQLELVAEED